MTFVFLATVCRGTTTGENEGEKNNVENLGFKTQIFSRI